MAAIASLAPKCLVVSPASKHTATVIFVHGLGDTGHGWKPVADMFRADPDLSHVKWVLPHSPTRAVTANMGIEMPSWFDIYSFGFNTAEDEEGMVKSAKSINELLNAEVESGMDPSRIVLGGFSQGAAMSLLTGLTSEKKLAGVVALSGWLPMKNRFLKLAAPHAATVPIFWGHGALDPLVKLQFSKDSLNALTEHLDFSVTAGTTSYYPGVSYTVYDNIGHTTSQRELGDLKTWLKKALPKV